LGDNKFAAFFTAFTQQILPTNNLGNPAQLEHYADAKLLAASSRSDR
jgi:uncharacterized protein YukJ